MKTGKYANVKLSKSHLFAMAVAATEAFPKEVMGLLTFRRYHRSMIIGTVVPLMSAKQLGNSGVQNSKNSWEVIGWAGEITQVMDAWHTHPYGNQYQLAAYPSKADVEYMDIHEFEIIMSLQPLQRKTKKPWHRVKKGLECSMNGFKFRVRAWKKVSEKKVEELLIVLAN